MWSFENEFEPLGVRFVKLKHGTTYMEDLVKVGGAASKKYQTRCEFSRIFILKTWQVWPYLALLVIVL